MQVTFDVAGASVSLFVFIVSLELIVRKKSNHKPRNFLSISTCKWSIIHLSVFWSETKTRPLYIQSILQQVILLLLLFFKQQLLSHHDRYIYTKIILCSSKLITATIHFLSHTPEDKHAHQIPSKNIQLKIIPSHMIWK